MLPAMEEDPAHDVIVRDASRLRIWAPFVMGWAGGALALLFESTLGKFLGVYNPLTGYLAAEIFAGLAIGFVAAIASRTWLGMLTLVLGFLTAGATVGIAAAIASGHDLGYAVFAAFYYAFWLGFLGAPIYVIVTGIRSMARWLARASRPAGRDQV